MLHSSIIITIVQKKRILDTFIINILYQTKGIQGPTVRINKS